MWPVSYCELSFSADSDWADSWSKDQSLIDSARDELRSWKEKHECLTTNKYKKQLNKFKK